MTSMLQSLGLLVLRVGLGAMMLLGHGLGKLLTFGERAAGFFDPFGLGGPFSLALATFAEFFCSLLVILGLFTRLACIPLIATMATAAFLFHAEDPWRDRELAVLFLLGFTVLLITGGGWFSADRWFWSWRRTRKERAKATSAANASARK